MRSTFGRIRLKRVSLLLCAVAVVLAGNLVTASRAQADDLADTGFSLQVSPSPLVATVTPGSESTLSLQIRNTGSQTQSLKMGLRSFSVTGTSDQVKLNKTAPSDISQFVSFSNPSFTLASGQIFTQTVRIDTPASAGFSYSFAITVSQVNPPKAQNGKTAIQGSVAVFTLLDVNRVGATRKLDLVRFSVSKRAYEYLPATITLVLKNSGNTLAQPKGTIFIQRGVNDTRPLASIPLNAAGGYILPGTSRSLSVSWSDGFPRYQTVNINGASKQHLSWQGGDISKLRVGRYVAKVVAVYNDGDRDVPLNAEVSFWVLPWRFFLILLIIVTLIIIGAVTTIRKSSKAIRHKSAKKHVPTPQA